MEKIANLIFDIKDDSSGTIFKEVFPEYKSIPNLIKTASTEEPGEHEYALVLINDGEKFCKFAMHDAGNTALSVIYLIKQASQLPKEAVKIASDNLINASGRFSLPIPEELKDLAKGLNGVVVGVERAARDGEGVEVCALVRDSRRRRGGSHEIERRTRLEGHDRAARYGDRDLARAATERSPIEVGRIAPIVGAG
jgi:hypothetical protein